MAIVLAQSAAMTKSKLKKGFNGDNFNLNGRVVPTDEADRGYKAAGSINPPFVSLLASGTDKGFAVGAVAAFNDYCADIEKNKYASKEVFERYFQDMDSVVEKCSIEGARLSCASVCIYEDCVVAAKSGGCHILRFSQGELFEIALSDAPGGREYQTVDAVFDGDMFVVIGEDACGQLDYDAILNILDSGNDVKIIIRDLYKLLSAQSENNCSVIAVKVKCDEKETFAHLPILDNDTYTDTFDPEQPINENELLDGDSDAMDVGDETPKNGKKPSAKKRVLGLIPIIILVIVLAVSAALFFATRRDAKPSVNEGETSSDGSAILMPEADTNGDFNGSVGMQTVDDTGVNDMNLSADATTTSPSVTTTRAPETTTQAPTTQATTNAPTTETTTAETTTNSDNTTTTEPTTASTTTPPDEGGDEDPGGAGAGEAEQE